MRSGAVHVREGEEREGGAYGTRGEVNGGAVREEWRRGIRGGAVQKMAVQGVAELRTERGGIARQGRVLKMEGKAERRGRAAASAAEQVASG